MEWSRQISLSFLVSHNLQLFVKDRPVIFTSRRARGLEIFIECVKMITFTSPRFKKFLSASILLNFRSNFTKCVIKGVTPDFDLSLSYQISWTGDASFNRIFLMKHLTRKVFSDSLSAVTEPHGGSKELLKFETSKWINFGYSYPIFMKILPFDFIFKCLSKLVVSWTNSHPFSRN